MPEELSDVTVAPAEAPETVDTPADNSTAQPDESVDKWEAIDFSVKEPAADADAPATEPESDTTITPSDEQELGEDEPAETPSEDITPEQVEAAQGGVTPLGRAKLRALEEQVITPLRDPNVPIEDVKQALAAFQPERMREMELAIVNDSAEKFPNEWLQALTGIEGLTVEKVKQLVESPNQPQAAIEQGDDLGNYLTEFYGEDWKDPAKDSEMVGDDARLAVIARQMEAMKGQNQDSEWKAKATELEAKLNGLQPQIEEFKARQDADYETFKETTYNTKVKEYTDAVETRVVPKILTEAGLDVSENDTDGVKAVKNLVREAFQAKHGASQFDLYLGNEYPQREALGKTIQRIDAEIQLASKKEAMAEKKAVSASDKKQLLAEAQAHWNEALNQQDAVTVMHKKAAAEFLKTLNGPMSLLEENAQLQRQLGLNGGRVEITGSASAPGKTLREAIREKGDDKWNIDFLTEQMSQGARS